METKVDNQRQIHVLEQRIEVLNKIIDDETTPLSILSKTMREKVKAKRQLSQLRS